MASVAVRSPAPAQVDSGSRRSSRRDRGGASGRRWRIPVLVVAGIYFLVPLYAGLRFALASSPTGFSGFTLRAFSGLPHQAGFSAAFTLSLRLVVIATVVALVLMVPTSVYIHLRLPRLRRLFESITLLPIVIPPVVLIVGVLQVAPEALAATPDLLGLEYAVLAMPFVYRSLDAGLRAIDVRTLVEASRSLGGGFAGTIWRVVLPNIRGAVMSATVLSVALVLGEFTMASLDQYVTFPVWIVQFDQQNGHVTVAASIAALLVTWLLLLAISALDGRRRSGRASPSTGLAAPALGEPGGM